MYGHILRATTRKGELQHVLTKLAMAKITELTDIFSPPLFWYQLGRRVYSIGGDLLPIRLPSSLHLMLSTFLNSTTMQLMRMFEGWN